MSRSSCSGSGGATPSHDERATHRLLVVFGVSLAMLTAAACGDESPVGPPAGPAGATTATRLAQIDAIRQYVLLLSSGPRLGSEPAGTLLELIDAAAESVERGEEQIASELLQELAVVTETLVDQGELFAPNAEPILNSAGNVFAHGILLVSIAAGERHACGLTSSGVAYCWGANEFGQLGDGGNTRRELPSAVAGNLTFAQIDAAGEVTCALTAGGRAYCWGMNVGGQLADGSTTDSSQPVAVSGDLTLSQISVGTDHVCGLTGSGVAHCWGGGPRAPDGTSFGRDLGLGTPLSETCPGRRQPSLYVCTTKPLPVSTSLTFASIGVGEWHTCGLRSDGTVYCWGWDAFCELGLSASCEFGSGVAATITPTLVAGSARFVSLHVGAIANCGITSGNDVYCWGLGTAAGSTDRVVPIPAPLNAGLGFRSVNVTGEDFIFPHACGVAEGGEAHCWGAGVASTNVLGGHLGNGLPPATTCRAFSSPCTPSPSPVFGGIDFSAVATGQAFTCGVAKTGEAFCWGLNDDGQLGRGDVQNRVTPVRVGLPAAPGSGAASRSGPGGGERPSGTVVP